MTREEAIKDIRENIKPVVGGKSLDMAIEALEQKRGEWIDGLDVPKEEREKHPYVYLHGEKYCSVCYKEAYFDTDYGQQLFEYCPNCGADMRERREDERIH